MATSKKSAKDTGNELLDGAENNGGEGQTEGPIESAIRKYLTGNLQGSTDTNKTLEESKAWLKSNMLQSMNGVAAVDFVKEILMLATSDLIELVDSIAEELKVPTE
jgi:hypothetical protein